MEGIFASREVEAFHEDVHTCSLFAQRCIHSPQPVNRLHSKTLQGVWNVEDVTSQKQKSEWWLRTPPTARPCAPPAPACLA